MRRIYPTPQTERMAKAEMTLVGIIASIVLIIPFGGFGLALIYPSIFAIVTSPAFLYTMAITLILIIGIPAIIKSLK